MNIYTVTYSIGHFNAIHFVKAQTQLDALAFAKDHHARNYRERPILQGEWHVTRCLDDEGDVIRVRV